MRICFCLLLGRCSHASIVEDTMSLVFPYLYVSIYASARASLYNDIIKLQLKYKYNLYKPTTATICSSRRSSMIYCDFMSTLPSTLQMTQIGKCCYIKVYCCWDVAVPLRTGSRGYDIVLPMSVYHNFKHNTTQVNTNTNNSITSKYSQELPLHTAANCLGPHF